MKKVLASIISLFTYVFVAIPAYAQSTTVTVCPGGQFNPLCTSKPAGSIIASVIQILLIAAVVIALIFLIIGGLRWITSGGDKTKLEAARGTVVAAIVGLIVAFAAFFIIQLVLTIFHLGSITQGFVIPSIL